MVSLVREGHVILMNQAVLAPPVGTLTYLMAQTLGDTLLLAHL
jgi:hypothetical protein